MGKNIHGQNIIDGTIDSSALTPALSSSITQLETINDIQDVSIATLFSTIYESTQYVSVTDPDAYIALILDASINILAGKNILKIPSGFLGFSHSPESVPSKNGLRLIRYCIASFYCWLKFKPQGYKRSR